MSPGEVCLQECRGIIGEEIEKIKATPKEVNDIILRLIKN